jgi:hypothetical protein
LYAKKYTPIKISKNYYLHSSCPQFFNVNDMVGLAIIDDFEQSSMNMPQLNENLSKTDYVDSLTNVFMN